MASRQDKQLIFSGLRSKTIVHIRRTEVGWADVQLETETQVFGHEAAQTERRDGNLWQHAVDDFETAVEGFFEIVFRFGRAFARCLRTPDCHAEPQATV